MDFQNLTNVELIALGQEGNMEAKNFFFDKNKNYFYKKSLDWFNKLKGFVEFDDIQSAVYLGAVKAFNSFKHEKKLSYTTLADICIDNEVRGYLRVHNRRNKLSLVSLEGVSTSSDNGQDKKIHEIISDGKDYYKDFIDAEFTKSTLNIVIKEFYRTSDKKWIQVFEKTYYEGKTQNEIAKEIGHSQPYVSRVQKKIALELRNCSKLVEV